MPTQQATSKELDQYFARAAGGWLGKNIGGTLGMPFEGNPGVLILSFYDPVPTKPEPNDDFEIQLIWCAMLKDRGLRLVPGDFPLFFDRHLTMTISEYQMAVSNHRAGLVPPICGAYNNWFIHGMGATIRSEIWAMIAPGRPEIAAAYAYMDAMMDHAGEGIWGEMFLAALESVAFTESDRFQMIESALRYIPEDCQVSGVVRLVMSEYRKGTDPVRVRHLICADFGHPMDFTYVPANVGFIMLGLLYGENFGDALCLAVNCGYDTDCTGATLGAILGIMASRDGIPERWLAPVGERVVISEFMRALEYPKDITQLTEMTADFARQVAEDEGLVEHLYRWTGLDFLKTGVRMLEVPSSTRVRLASDERLTVDLDYLDDPALGYGEVKKLELSLTNETAAVQSCRVALELPQGLELVPAVGSNGSAGVFNCELPAAGVLTRHLNIRVKDGHQHAAAAGQLTATLDCQGETVCQARAGLIYKSCWLVTDPIDADDVHALAELERLGRLDPDDVWVHRRQLSTYSLNELFPQPGQVVFAQLDVEVGEDEGERVIANNSGPIRVWLDGEMIVNKTHRMHGIMPSWHLQSNPLHGYTMDTFGCADVALTKGWHSFLVRLDGRELAQDAIFYLVGMCLGPEGQVISDRRMIKPFSRATAFRWKG